MNNTYLLDLTPSPASLINQIQLSPNCLCKIPIPLRREHTPSSSFVPNSPFMLSSQKHHSLICMRLYRPLLTLAFPISPRSLKGVFETMLGWRRLGWRRVFIFCWILGKRLWWFGVLRRRGWFLAVLLYPDRPGRLTRGLDRSEQHKRPV
jgi:hypothetical protein